LHQVTFSECSKRAIDVEARVGLLRELVITVMEKEWFKSTILSQFYYHQVYKQVT
jgi:hypothetical protein